MISLILIGLLCFCSCVFLALRFTYWKRRNIPFKPLKFPYIFGNISSEKHVALQFANIYKNHRMENSPMIGIYTMFLKPALLIVDPNLIRQVLVGDFKSFRDRGMFHNEKVDALSGILGTLSHDVWKPIRSKLTREFTPAKIREKFSIMKKVGDELVVGLNAIVNIDSEVEIREEFGKYAVDVIGFIALGLRFECLNDPRTQLQKMIRKAMQSHSKFPLNIFKNTCPELAREFGMRKYPKDVSDFFVDIIKQTIQYRAGQNEKPNDYMQVLIDAGLTTDQIAALAFDFLSAGYADITSTLSYCLYELALSENEEIQERARNEIEFVLEQHGGELTPDVLDKMHYCKSIIRETLRKHPVAGNITRIATKPYKVPNTNYTIPKGMRIYVPIYGIHHDETIYPNPEEFNPERFSEGNCIPANAFLPFGDGPRKCIGYAFAKLLIQTGLVVMLQNFRFSTCQRTQIPMKYSPTKNTLIPDNGVLLSVQCIETSLDEN